MPLLQVRDFPEPLYRALEERAREERRSISQQTIVLLDHALGPIPDNKKRRKALLKNIDDIHTAYALDYEHLSNPALLIREDRER